MTQAPTKGPPSAAAPTFTSAVTESDEGDSPDVAAEAVLVPMGRMGGGLSSPDGSRLFALREQDQRRVFRLEIGAVFVVCGVVGLYALLFGFAVCMAVQP